MVTKILQLIFLEYKHMIRYCVDTLCIGFVDFVLKGKSLLECSNLFSPNEDEMNDKKILKYFQQILKTV